MHMFKRILKSLAWGLLTKDVYYRGKMYHANNGRAPDYALVKAWKKESYTAFMDDPHWRQRIAVKDTIVLVVAILMFAGVLIFMAHN